MTKKELLQENNDLKEVFNFYFDYPYKSTNELIIKIKKTKKRNQLLCKICYVLTLIFLCATFYLLGLGN